MLDESDTDLADYRRGYVPWGVDSGPPSSRFHRCHDVCVTYILPTGEVERKHISRASSPDGVHGKGSGHANRSGLVSSKLIRWKRERDGLGVVSSADGPRAETDLSSPDRRPRLWRSLRGGWGGKRLEARADPAATHHTRRESVPHSWPFHQDVGAASKCATIVIALFIPPPYNDNRNQLRDMWGFLCETIREHG